MVPRTKTCSKYGLKFESGRLFCRFCEVEGLKAKCYGSEKTSNYLKHLKASHIQHWHRYVQIKTHEERETFFAELKKRRGRLTEHFQVLDKKRAWFSVPKKIWHTIKKIDAHDEHHQYQECAFEIRKESFLKAMNLVSYGLTFSQVERTLNLLCPESCGNTRQAVSGNIQKCVLMALTKIADFLEKCNSFSLAADAATHCNVAYFDIRVRFMTQSEMKNLNVIAWPAWEKHTGQELYNIVENILSCLCDDWKNKIVSVSTDGASNMTGKFKGFVSILQQNVPGVKFVYCYSHQLDLVIKKAVKLVDDGRWRNLLNKNIAVLGRSQNLIKEMKGSRCPNYSNVRWSSLYAVLKWLLKYRNQISSSSSFDKAWWDIAEVVSGVLNCVNIVVKQLQHSELSVEKSIIILNALSTSIEDTECGDNPAASQYKDNVISGIESILSVEKLNDLASLPINPYKTILRKKSEGGSMVGTIEKYFGHRLFEDFDFHKARRQEANLYLKYEIDADFRNIVKSTESLSYVDAWKLLPKFEHFRNVLDPLAVMFASTASVEGDWSILNGIKRKERVRMSDMSLIGSLHAKQFHKLYSSEEFDALFVNYVVIDEDHAQAQDLEQEESKLSKYEEGKHNVEDIADIQAQEVEQEESKLSDDEEREQTVIAQFGFFLFHFLSLYISSVFHGLFPLFVIAQFGFFLFHSLSLYISSVFHEEREQTMEEDLDMSTQESNNHSCTQNVKVSIADMKLSNIELSLPSNVFAQTRKSNRSLPPSGATRKRRKKKDDNFVY